MRGTIALAAVTFALLPGTALATHRDPVLVDRICGRDECRLIKHGLAVVRGEGAASVAADVPPPPLGEYYEIAVHYYAITANDPPSRGFFVPRARLLRIRPPTSPGPSVWLPTTPQVAAALMRVTRGLKPFGAPELTRVFVGDHEAANPEAFARLYDPFPRAPDVGVRAARRPIVLRSEPPSPWTDGWANLDYVPDAGVLVRGSEVVRPAPDVIALLEDPTAERFNPSLTDLATVAVLVLILAVALAAVALAWRRSRTPPDRFAKPS